MGLPRATLYVVASGTNDRVGEEKYCKKVLRLVDQFIDEHPGKMAEYAPQVYPTDKGVVELVLFDNSFSKVNSTKAEVIAYLQEQGYQLVRELPGARGAITPGLLIARVPAGAGLGGDDDSSMDPSPPPATNPPARARGTPMPGAGSVQSAAAAENHASHRAVHAPHTQEPPSDTLVITEDLLYVLSQQKKPRSSRDLSKQLECSEELIDAALAQMSNAGLVAYTVKSVFTLTEAGVEQAAKTTYRGGRKGVMEALLEEQSHRLTYHQIAERLGCTITVPKASIRLLRKEGLVEPVGTEPRRSGQGHARIIVGLTEAGLRVGHNYQPPTSPGWAGPGGWGRPGDTRLAVVELLLNTAGTTLQASEVANQTGKPLRTVTGALAHGHKVGYLDRVTLAEEPLTYGYSLTEAGRSAAVIYQHQNRLTPEGVSVSAREQSRAGQAYLDRQSRLIQVSDTVVFKVTLDGTPSETAEANELLDKLGAIQGVRVEPWPA